MDINCVSGCEYQKDGKCALTELPAAGALNSGVTGRLRAGCAYFVKREAGTNSVNP